MFVLIMMQVLHYQIHLKAFFQDNLGKLATER